MTIQDIYTILLSCDRARARAVKAKREAEERLAQLEELRTSLTARLREGDGR